MLKFQLVFVLFFVTLFVTSECRRHGGGLGGQPLTCRNDKACIRAGLLNHYCRNRGPKIFRSECVPKRGRIL